MIDLSKLGITSGPWEWYTSCSYNRLGTQNGCHELLYPVRYGDGQPGIEWRKKEDSTLIEASPNMLSALITGDPEERKAAIEKATGRPYDEVMRWYYDSI